MCRHKARPLCVPVFPKKHRCGAEGWECAPWEQRATDADGRKNLMTLQLFQPSSRGRADQISWRDCIGILPPTRAKPSCSCKVLWKMVPPQALPCPDPQVHASHTAIPYLCVCPHPRPQPYPNLLYIYVYALHVASSTNQLSPAANIAGSLTSI